MEKVKNFFGIGSSSKKRAADSAKKDLANKEPEKVEEEDPVCINEIQHLVGHKDIVRNIVCVDVDEKKVQYLISSSDDTTIRIWDAHSGRLIHTLDGHTMPIKCILVIDNRPPTKISEEEQADEKTSDLKRISQSLILISSSSDRSIRIWDILTGKCLQILDKQNGSVFSLAAIPNRKEKQPDKDTPDCLELQTVQLAPRVFKNVKRFCSGASDNDIQIWSITPDKGIVHSGKIKSYDGEKENLSWVLVINPIYVAAGYSSNCGIAVYSLENLSFIKLLTYHRELPQSITCLSSRQFVSGSLDGTIIVWNSESFLAEHTPHSPPKYLKDEREYLYNISFLLPINERYLVAGIGKGFTVFDLCPGTDASKAVLQCTNAHDAALTCALAICDGAYLLTSSEDTMIKMWKVPPHINLSGKPVDSEAKEPAHCSGSDAPRPELAAELFGHSNVVSDIVKIDEYSFASCSLDTEVIIWKDGYRQSELRNEYALFSLLNNSK